MTRIRTENLGGATAWILHRPHPSVQGLIRQLGVIGLKVREAWPELPAEAIGGLFVASKIASANQGAGTGEFLMNVIAAAVIGGTSLFGGRGRTWDALLGVLVIVSIQYGLALEGIAAPVQYMITGGVLLTTVVIDAVTRRTQKTAGRA